MLVGNRDCRALVVKAGLLLNTGHFLERRRPERARSRAAVALRLSAATIAELAAVLRGNQSIAYTGQPANARLFLVSGLAPPDAIYTSA